MLPLPHPVRGGTIDDLRPFVNVADEDAWMLLVGWTLMTLHPNGPYPILRLGGEQDSAKTTTSTAIRNLIDPNESPLVGMPESEDALMIMSHNARIAAFDNLSGVTKRMSDALCRLSTRGAYRARKLYKNLEEVIISVTRPVILNGIDVASTRGDFLSRTVSLHLPPIAKTVRRPEDEFWTAYEAARPRILGAILDAISSALTRVGQITLTDTPRLIDFARWVTAAEPALGWEDGAFLDAYRLNYDGLSDSPLESPLTDPIEQLLAGQDRWEGTPTDLLKVLASLAGQAVTERVGWPINASRLSVQLNRLAPSLRARRGIDVQHDRSGNRKVVLQRVNAGQPPEADDVDAMDTTSAIY